MAMIYFAVRGMWSSVVLVLTFYPMVVVFMYWRWIAASYFKGN